MFRKVLVQLHRAVVPVSIGLSIATGFAPASNSSAAPWSPQTKEKESDSLLGATADERDVADNLRNWRAGSLLDKLARADTGDISPDRRVIVVLGITGAGKSSTCNTLAGRTHAQFKLSNSITSVTASVSYRGYTFVNMDWRVIDTPGLFDTNKSDKDTKEEVAKLASMAPHGVSAFFLVVPRGRFTAEHELAIRGLMEVFGESAKRHMCVVITSALQETTDRQLMTRDQMMDEINALPMNHFFRRFIEELGMRVIPIDNRLDQQRQVSRLVMHQRVVDMTDKNKGHTYDVQQLLKKLEPPESVLQAALRDLHFSHCTQDLKRRRNDKKLIFTMECEVLE